MPWSIRSSIVVRTTAGTHTESLQRDVTGIFPGVALGFRRLSIIDLAGGHQPMSNEDGSVWLVFNGEIYNYRELRRRLEGSGHIFRTDSDSETIVHLYEDLGVECFRALEWDVLDRDLGSRQNVKSWLARDRLGKKPAVLSMAGWSVAIRERTESAGASPRVQSQVIARRD